jgi:hypothetical protein
MREEPERAPFSFPRSVLARVRVVGFGVPRAGPPLIVEPIVRSVCYHGCFHRLGVVVAVDGSSGGLGVVGGGEVVGVGREGDSGVAVAELAGDVHDVDPGRDDQ